MEQSVIISCAALVVAAVTAVSSFFVFLRYDRRLKKQEKQLNDKLDFIYDFQISQINVEKANQNRADLLVVALPYNGNGNHTIRISNKGKGKARNIRLGDNTMTQSNGIILNRFKTIEGLESMGRADFILSCSEGMKNNQQLTLIWNDEIEENVSKEFSINL